MPLRDVPDDAIELIKRFEGIPDGNPKTVNINPYLDPIGIWTIGWGHAIRWKGSFLRGKENEAVAESLYPGGITLDQATQLLKADSINTGRDVLSVVTVDLNDNEFGALVSFTFNLGIGNLSKSNLLKLLNANNRTGAADQFGKWVMAGGTKMSGLVRRREAERKMFLGLV